ncbi:MAG: hypothetical protein HZB15_06010, partial [Actinobacteria bacterium]|nr:hypothetical protein [Actinomycetota bacterium]
TTRLSAGGQFSVFNLAGTVDVIIDVNGYYVDHDHDDRYYTKQQSDALRLGIDDNGRIALGPADFAATSFLPEAAGGPSNWVRSPSLTHNGPSSLDCVTAPVDLPTGRAVTSVHVIYTAVSGATLDGSLVGAQGFAGSSDQAIDEQTLAAGAFPTTPAGVLVDGTMNVLVPSPARAGYGYGLTLCTAEQITITGVWLQLA